MSEPTDKPCLCGIDAFNRYHHKNEPHAPGCPSAPNAPKEPAAPECKGLPDCNPPSMSPYTGEFWPAVHALNCPKRPAPPPEPTTPEAKSADFEWDWAEGRARAYTLETAADRGDRNLGRAYLALRAELAAKDEKLRGLDYLYGELGNQNSFLRAELAEAKAEIERLGGLTNLHTVQLSEGRAELAAEKAAREKAEAERDELALLAVPTDADAEIAVRLRIAEARVEELEALLARFARAEAALSAYLDRDQDDSGVDGVEADLGEEEREADEAIKAEGLAILAARSAKGGANG